MLGYILLTVAALKAARAIRRDLLISSEPPLTAVALGDGTESLATILNGNLYKDEWRFISSLIQSSPWEEYPRIDIPHLEEVSFQGRLAVGMTRAQEENSLVFSFGHSPDWNSDFIRAQIDTVDVLDNASQTPVDVPNLSAPRNVAAHTARILSYGRRVSASSLVYEGDGFFVRMFFDDHEPPHFHILLRRDSSQTQAKCAISTLDILSGSLPSVLRKRIRDWAQNRREELMRNWARCRNGQHPFLVGGPQA